MVRPVAEHSEAPSPQPRFEFDRRPLGWVVLSRLKRQVLLLGLFSAFLWIRSMTPPEGLDETAWSALVGMRKREARDAAKAELAAE